MVIANHRVNEMVQRLTYRNPFLVYIGYKPIGASESYLHVNKDGLTFWVISALRSSILLAKVTISLMHFHVYIITSWWELLGWNQNIPMNEMYQMCLQGLYFTQRWLPVTIELEPDILCLHCKWQCIVQCLSKSIYTYVMTHHNCYSCDVLLVVPCDSIVM